MAASSRKEFLTYGFVRECNLSIPNDVIALFLDWFQMYDSFDTIKSQASYEFKEEMIDEILCQTATNINYQAASAYGELVIRKGMKFEWKFSFVRAKTEWYYAIIGIIDNQKLLASNTKIGDFYDESGEGYGLWTGSGNNLHHAKESKDFPYFAQFDHKKIKSITLRLDMTQENGILSYVVDQPGFSPDTKHDNIAWNDIDINKGYRMAVLVYGMGKKVALQRYH